MDEDNKKIGILIVEDEVPLLDTYAEILSGEGYQVFKAEGGVRGLQLIEENKAVIKVVFLDLMMSGMDGLDVLRKVKSDSAKYGSPKVIVLTNMTSEQIIKEAFMIGADSYLIKSELDAKDMKTEIANVLPQEAGAAQNTN
ncbi:response regulator transcription factor [Candidatus Nomurabacteria bacterium]|nr:response regulator transcription factor [Candidatus Nomurabacteria bacterium]